MKKPLSRRQLQMLKAAYSAEQVRRSPWGYAPCGRGFKSTMRSLVRMGLAFATGSEDNIRGIVLSKEGERIASQQTTLSQIYDSNKQHQVTYEETQDHRLQQARHRHR